jgi:hypothetical protein
MKRLATIHGPFGASFPEILKNEAHAQPDSQ